jgi:hypothetical protein
MDVGVLLEPDGSKNKPDHSQGRLVGAVILIPHKSLALIGSPRQDMCW